MTTPTSKRPSAKKRTLLNIFFLAACLLILLFLLKAPPETTPRLPQDQNHQQFFAMERKAAENHCEQCHNPDGIRPLSEDHPPTFRCLFCHKREPLVSGQP